MCETCSLREPIRHRQVVCDPQPVYPGPEYQGRPDPVHVDAGIHVLLQAIWAAGLETQFSCEGWPEDSHGAHLYGTHGYILFHTADQAIEFFRASHERSAARDVLCPHLVFETHIGMDIFQVRSADLPPRGVIRFRHTDLKELEELWTA